MFGSNRLCRGCRRFRGRPRGRFRGRCPEVRGETLALQSLPYLSSAPEDLAVRSRRTAVSSGKAVSAAIARPTSTKPAPEQRSPPAPPVGPGSPLDPRSASVIRTFVLVAPPPEPRFSLLGTTMSVARCLSLPASAGCGARCGPTAPPAEPAASEAETWIGSTIDSPSPAERARPARSPSSFSRLLYSQYYF
jgi:hypothetical protein